MKKKTKIFELDKDQKDLLQRVSSICGIRRASVQQVWEYTIYTILMGIAENKGSIYDVLHIPYLGKVLLKESKEHPGEYDTFFCVFDNIKEAIRSVKKDNLQDLISYFEENFIKNDIEAIETDRTSVVEQQQKDLSKYKKKTKSPSTNNDEE